MGVFHLLCQVHNDSHNILQWTYDISFLGMNVAKYSIVLRKKQECLSGLM